MNTQPSSSYDFFISFDEADLSAAVKIDSILRERGYRTFLPLPGTSAASRIDHAAALRNSTRMIGVLSDAYTKSKRCADEREYFTERESGTNSTLVLLIQVARCQEDGWEIGHQVTDVIGLSGEELKDRVSRAAASPIVVKSRLNDFTRTFSFTQTYVFKEKPAQPAEKPSSGPGARLIVIGAVTVLLALLFVALR